MGRRNACAVCSWLPASSRELLAWASPKDRVEFPDKVLAQLPEVSDLDVLTELCGWHTWFVARLPAGNKQWQHVIALRPSRHCGSHHWSSTSRNFATRSGACLAKSCSSVGSATMSYSSALAFVALGAISFHWFRINHL